MFKNKKERNIAIIVGVITLLIVVGIAAADIVMWSKRSGLYTFKAPPAPAKIANALYPNGEPGPDGKPKNSTTLPPSLTSQIGTNLNAYLTKGVSSNPSDWGPTGV